MKKLFLVALCFSMFSLFASAQAFEGKVKLKKVEQPALIMVYDYPGEVVENALKAKLADRRLKGDKSKGFYVYTNSVINEISNTPLDYSFKIDENGKKGKEKTTVYMVMEGSNVLSGDPSVMAANGKGFLQGLVPDVERSNIIAQIKRQEEILVKEEKRLKNLVDDHTSLEKKMKENELDQEQQQKVIASQKAILEDLKAKQN